MSIKIAVTYEKGGVGKTTTAVNLSAILAERGFKVLLVDLDCQSYATSYFDLYDEALPSIDSVMRGTSSARDTIRLISYSNLYENQEAEITSLKNFGSHYEIKLEGKSSFTFYIRETADGHFM